MRDDTIACIEALDIAGAHLVGWSDGGIIALMVAIARPDLAGRIVTLGSNASDDAYTPAARTLLGRESPMLDLIRPDYDAASPDGPDHWPVVLEKVQTMWWDDPLDFRTELGGIDQPTMVMAGDDDCIRASSTRSTCSGASRTDGSRSFPGRATPHPSSRRRW